MTSLTLFDAATVEVREQTSDAERIRARLQDAGIGFERWDAGAVLDEAATDEAVLAAYRPQIERLMADRGYQSADVIHMRPDHPDRAALREKFLQEHTHGEDEVRFFVRGCGLFNLHLGEAVYSVRCERGDLLSVPAGTPHWFDMGPAPRFTAIRLFGNPEGWIASNTGDAIAARFPRLDTPAPTA